MTEGDDPHSVSTRKQRRRANNRSFVFACIGWILLIFVALCLTQLISSYITKKRIKGHKMLRTVSNAKQLYLGLMDFESDYGYFPDDASASRARDLNSFRGTHANDYLGQLIAGGYVKEEDVFFAKDFRYTQKPDDVIEPATSILEKNECGFSYVMVEENGKRRGLSTDDDANIPILVAPLVNEWGSFEPTTYDQHGIYLRIDGSARHERLRKSDQKIEISKGKTLFDSGPGTFWGKLKPVVLLPER